MVDETKLCPNCKRDISSANFIMHEMHCRRHIVLCQHCGEPIHRSEMEQHFNEFHAQIPCDKCWQMVSRPGMAKHEEEDCMKKLMKCEYCELSLPKDELEAHLDYCGSRTECCPVCRQYIMHKDRLRHENSRCTYPEPKPQALDPFSMGELQQLMANSVLGNLSSAVFRKGRIPFHRKSEENAQRAKNILMPEQADDALGSIPPDVDYDTMLALQLAHEDWLQDGQHNNDSDSLDHIPYFPGESGHRLEDLDDILTDGIEPWSNLVQRPHLGTSVLNSQITETVDEDMNIPCEFCGSKVPMSIYIAHSDSCPQGLQRLTTDLNNGQASVQPITNKPAIAVINNLQPLRPSPEYRTFVEDDSFMLPCEFCEETFLSDMLIQHQSACQAGLTSPRAATPPRDNRDHAAQQPSNQTSFKHSIRSPPKRHMQAAAASVEFAGQDGSSDPVVGDLNNARLHKINESISNKYSPAYSRFDEAVTRPPQRLARQHGQSSVEGLEPKKESKSTQRTRAKLNQLLQDDVEVDSKEVGLGSIKKQPGSLSSGRDMHRTERKSKVDSRTVMRQLEETRQKASPGSRSPASQNGNPAAGDRATMSRNRRRADQLFSPELRLKPEHSLPPKK